MVVRQVGVTLIDRDAPSKDAMRWVGGRLKAGEVVGIFPEGTRSSDGHVMPFKGGVEFLVRRSKATVVPVGIDGAFRAYPRRAWFPRPRKVIVRVGEPWSAEQVLAAGGVEALRRRVAELARAPLSVADAAEIDPDQSRPSASATATPSNPQNQPVDGDA